MNPLELSLNVTRGTAMHAILRYALWVHRIFERTARAELARGFDAMSEVRDELEWHLANDRALSVRAVYGKWFPWLVLLDERWARERAAAIFPSDDRALRDAAWDSYLVYSPAYDVPFDILAPQYRPAVEEPPVSKPRPKRH